MYIYLCISLRYIVPGLYGVAIKLWSFYLYVPLSGLLVSTNHYMVANIYNSYQVGGIGVTVTVELGTFDSNIILYLRWVTCEIYFTLWCLILMNLCDEIPNFLCTIVPMYTLPVRLNINLDAQVFSSTRTIYLVAIAWKILRGDREFRRLRPTHLTIRYYLKRALHKK